MTANPQFDQPAWGIQINTRRYNASDCPSWASQLERAAWRKPGVVLWDHTHQRITRLFATQALHILEHLQTNEDWQQQGIIVGEPATRILIGEAKRGKRSNAKAQPSLEAQKPQPILTNTMQLSVEQTQQLMQVLHDHEADLQRMSKDEEQAKQAALHKVYSVLLGGIRANEAKGIDISARSLPWLFDEPSRTWTCTIAPNRVTVAPVQDNWAWQGCLERPSKFKHMSNPFDNLGDALAWAEQELHAATAAAQSPAVAAPEPVWLTLETITPEHRERLAPYLIEASALEPPRLTYRLVIYLNHQATSHKVYELSFGEKRYYDETYPTTLQLARDIRLDPNKVDVKELVEGRYRVTSLATYADASMAEGQVQRLWEGSEIAAAFRAGQITSAAYGIEEIETMYRRWIGWYGEWSQPTQDRAAFLAEKAFDLTVAHALDIPGFRSLLAMDADELSDEEALRMMHRRRIKAWAIPQAVRQESQQWLKEHA